MMIIPKQMKLLAYYAVTYACDSCEKDTGFAHIVTVKPLVPLMKHSGSRKCADHAASVCVSLHDLQTGRYGSCQYAGRNCKKFFISVNLAFPLDKSQ